MSFVLVFLASPQQKSAIEKEFSSFFYCGFFYCGRRNCRPKGLPKHAEFVAEVVVFAPQQKRLYTTGRLLSFSSNFFSFSSVISDQVHIGQIKKKLTIDVCQLKKWWSLAQHVTVRIPAQRKTERLFLGFLIEVCFFILVTK